MNWLRDLVIMDYLRPESASSGVPVEELFREYMHRAPARRPWWLGGRR
jgi:hypothetical protein